MIKKWISRKAVPREEEAKAELPGEAASVPGRSSAVENLFREHNAALISFLRMRLTSEQEARDVAQEAYVRLLQLDKPQELNFLKAYLYKIASNLAVDSLRRKQRQDKNEQAGPLFDFEAQPSQEKQVASRQELALVRKAVAELPLKQRQAFLLSRDGWSSGRIGAYMNVSDRTIRNYLCQALEHIENRLGDVAMEKRAGKHD